MVENIITIRGIFSILCPFAVEATSTTLMFVKCITFHRINFLDDGHNVEAILTGHKLRLRHLFKHTPHTRKYSRSGLIFTLKIYD